MKGPPPYPRLRRPGLLLPFIIASALPSSAWATDRDRPVPPSDEQTEPPTGNASEHFSRGVTFYKSGSLDAALAEFNRAYELRPDHRVLFNVGQVHSEKQDWVSAIRAFRLYLAEGADEIPADRAAAVRDMIKDAQGRVASVTIKANVLGEVLVDGASAGSTRSAAPVLVNAGIREIVVRADAFRPQSRRLILAGGEERSLDFVLEPVVALAGTDDGSVPGGGPSPRRGLSTGAWVSFGGALVLAGGAVITALLTRQAQQNFSNELGRTPGDRMEIDRDRTQLRLWAGMTDGLTIAAAACAAVGVYLALSPSRADRGQDRARAVGAEGLRRTPVANVDAIVTGNGIAIRGAF
jgi:hypothetical protein